MKWIKKGCIYCADGKKDWAFSHAALPTPYRLDSRILRIYCAFRSSENISRIGYVDVLAENPKEIVSISESPVLDIGKNAAFDDHGVVPASIVRHNDRLYLYYSGFQLGSNVPYYLSSGLAISDDNGYSFKRYHETPLLTRCDGEYFFRTAPHVIKDGQSWKMWYVGGNEWLEHNGKRLPRYTIKYLTSPDGISWGTEGQTCFQPQGDEHGFGRPYVVKEGDIYKMYYSIRTLSLGYRLGYAESDDGMHWRRKDQAMGLDVSVDGWDAKAICYSATITSQGKTYLFYNGNDYGGTGFGYAELEL